MDPPRIRPHRRRREAKAIYRALGRQGLNRRVEPVPEEMRRVVRQTAGELGQIDLHLPSRDLFLDPPEGEVYLVGVISDPPQTASAIRSSTARLFRGVRSAGSR